jgi:hypothetical protein
MGMMTIGKIPGKKDINGQFTPADLKNTLKFFKKIYKNGTYTFGDLTAECLGLGNDPDWIDALKAYNDGGPGKPSAADQIRDCVIAAMNHKKDSGDDDPLPIVITWHQSTSKRVDILKNTPGGFSIDIYGYPEPPASALGERRQKNK